MCLGPFSGWCVSNTQRRPLGLLLGSIRRRKVFYFSSYHTSMRSERRTKKLLFGIGLNNVKSNLSDSIAHHLYSLVEISAFGQVPTYHLSLASYPMTTVTWFEQTNVLLLGVAVDVLPLSQEQVWTIEGSLPAAII